LFHPGTAGEEKIGGNLFWGSRSADGSQSSGVMGE